jgi:hypothetical protein
VDVNVSRMLSVASRPGDESVTSGGRGASPTMPQPPMPKLAARRARQTWSGRPALRSGMRPGGGKGRQCTPRKYPVANRRCQFALSACISTVPRQITGFRLGQGREVRREPILARLCGRNKDFSRPWRRPTCGTMDCRYRRRLVCRGSKPPASGGPGRPYCFRRRHDLRRRRCRWPSGNPWHAVHGRRSGVPPNRLPVQPESPGATRGEACQ